MTDRVAYVLTVSGSDSSGCAGMQADNRVIHALGAMPLNVITANTLQTSAGVPDVRFTEPAVVEHQMRALLESYPVKAIKIGMLGNASLVEVVASVLADHADVFVVLDPVLLSSSGHALLDAEGIAALNAHLMPHVNLVTPNMDEQLHILPAEHTSVLIKGGHTEGDTCTDVLIKPDGSSREFSAPRIQTLNARGTGCALSAAIATNVAKGETLEDSVSGAKQLLQRSLENGRGKTYHGAGPSFIDPLS